MIAPNRASERSLTVAALFAGVGGIELGMHRAGHRTEFFCEYDAGATAVLKAQFPGVEHHADVRTLKSLPKADILTAGFPCQDLSQAGKTAGISGARSGLVTEVFRLLKGARHAPKWVLIENVPFMLRLARGEALRFVIESLEELGFRWAYRIVDSRAFGIPQRRQRVFILASRTEDPRPVLLAEDAGPQAEPGWTIGRAFGFYWTEGLRGLGAAVDAVPTLKGGSTIGIPSSPAILLPSGAVGTPDIRDLERLQGFPAGWTQPAESAGRATFRFKLVGNAVTVDVARWIAKRLAGTHRPFARAGIPIERSQAWPDAAWNVGNGRFAVGVSHWPKAGVMQPIAEFLRYPLRPLSHRAVTGFLSRARRGGLRFPEGFLASLERHMAAMERDSTTLIAPTPR